jgi:hypothetical protein
MGAEVGSVPSLGRRRLPEPKPRDSLIQTTAPSAPAPTAVDRYRSMYFSIPISLLAIFLTVSQICSLFLICVFWLWLFERKNFPYFDPKLA